MSEGNSQSDNSAVMKQRRFAAAANRTGKKHPGKAILAGTSHTDINSIVLHHALAS